MRSRNTCGFNILGFCKTQDTSGLEKPPDIRDRAGDIQVMQDGRPGYRIERPIHIAILEAFLQKCHLAGAGRFRARAFSSNSPEMSTATISTPRQANFSVKRPVPQPVSSARWPGAFDDEIGAAPGAKLPGGRAPAVDRAARHECRRLTCAGPGPAVQVARTRVSAAARLVGTLSTRFSGRAKSAEMSLVLARRGAADTSVRATKTRKHLTGRGSPARTKAAVPQSIQNYRVSCIDRVCSRPKLSRVM